MITATPRNLDESTAHRLRLMSLHLVPVGQDSRHSGSPLASVTTAPSALSRALARATQNEPLRQPGIEPGSTAWKATMLTTTPLSLGGDTSAVSTSQPSHEQDQAQTRHPAFWRTVARAGAVGSIQLVSIFRFRGVAVITSASHAEGPRFDPGRNHVSFCRAWLGPPLADWPPPRPAPEWQGVLQAGGTGPSVDSVAQR